MNRSVHVCDSTSSSGKEKDVKEIVSFKQYRALCGVIQMTGKKKMKSKAVQSCGDKKRIGTLNCPKK